MRAVRLQDGAQAQAALSAAQRDVNRALQSAHGRAVDWNGTVDVAGRLAAARRQLATVRLQAANGSRSVPDTSTSYDVIVHDLIDTVGELTEDRPWQASGQAADAYLAMLQAIEAAQREHVDVAAFEGTWAQLLAGMNDTIAAFARVGREQAVLRRVATLVAQRIIPAEVFGAVVAEVHMLLGAENTRLLRYEPDHTVTVIAARSAPEADIPLGTRYSLDGESVSAVVWHAQLAQELARVADGITGVLWCGSWPRCGTAS